MAVSDTSWRLIFEDKNMTELNCELLAMFYFYLLIEICLFPTPITGFVCVLTIFVYERSADTVTQPPKKQIALKQ